MKLHKYLASWFECDQGGSSYAKFVGGQCYPITEETTRHVSQGVAVEIEVDTSPERAEALAEKAKAAAERARLAAIAAQELLDAAVVAQQVADARAEAERLAAEQGAAAPAGDATPEPSATQGDALPSAV